MHKHRQQKLASPGKGGAETLITGLALSGVFGYLWLHSGQWFWIFPFVFGGLFTLLEGFKMLIRNRALKKAVPRQQALTGEKEVLRIVRENKGRVTPALVALRSELALDKAKDLLEDMVKKGFAQMNILEGGRIEFEFPDFLPDETNNRRLEF